LRIVALKSTISDNVPRPWSDGARLVYCASRSYSTASFVALAEARDLLMAEIHTGIGAKRLAGMDRVLTFAEAARSAPFAGFGDVEVCPDFAAKAGIYCARTSLTIRCPTATSPPATTSCASSSTATAATGRTARAVSTRPRR
jgi:hypothetical protein